MASMFGVFTFFEGESKSVQRGEQALKASHLVTFDYDPDMGSCRAKVQASMKDKTYMVEVSFKCSKMGEIADWSYHCPMLKFGWF